MTLSELLYVLRVNKSLYVSIVDGGKSVKTISAVEYDLIEDKYSYREVASVKITSPSTMSIYLDCEISEDEEDKDADVDVAK